MKLKIQIRKIIRILLYLTVGGVYGKAQMLEKGSVKYYTGNFFLL